MLLARPTKPLCQACRKQLFSTFVNGFAASSVRTSRLPSSHPITHQRSKALRTTKVRWLSGESGSAKSPTPEVLGLQEDGTHQAVDHPDQTVVDQQSPENSHEESSFDVERIVRQARDTYGETLPLGLLSPEQYRVYERLYGPPLRETSEEDAELLDELEEVEENVEEADIDKQEPVLLKENSDGELEEIKLAGEDGAGLDPQQRRLLEEQEKELKANEALLEDMTAAGISSENRGEIQNDEITRERLKREREEEEDRISAYTAAEVAMNAFDDTSDVDNTRTHPLTAAGRFRTNPITLELPRNTMVDPVAAILSTTSNKHISEAAHRVFGGGKLPDSTATPKEAAHLQQKPIALAAGQSSMTNLDANLYLAAIMPGAYASVMSTLVETRKRIGSGWLENLLKKPGGPRILDAGAGGAGVLAWHEILRAEWEMLHPDGSADNPVPLGKATVVTGSPELRTRASELLDNTTFLPRLPDYVPSRDLPGSDSHEPSLRKQYDIIVAPHTLWPLKEDYKRKAHVENFWTLLNPEGGVLIIIEKGLPGGFECVAGARKMLLENFISSPNATHVENELQSPKKRFTKKEQGMIIAPCTNHIACPMYKFPGQPSRGKDVCTFAQRYFRPPYLQQILGAKFHNYEDVRFSYLAVRRGIDDRQLKVIAQDEAATVAALAGFEKEGSQPHMLSLPRSVKPPLKADKHVTFDLCTPSGQIERWIVPRSFSKQGYRDARKARWGDLWALGAKTRVVRDIKYKVRNLPKKQVIEVGIGATTEEDTLRDITRPPTKGPKRDKWEKKKAKKEERRNPGPKKLREKDFL